MPDGGYQSREDRYGQYLDSGKAAELVLLNIVDELRENQQANAFEAFRNIIQMHIIAEIVQVNPQIFREFSPLMLITTAVGKCVKELEMGGVVKIEEVFERVIEMDEMSDGGQPQVVVADFIQNTTNKLLVVYPWLNIPRDTVDIERYFAEHQSDEDLEIAA